MVISTLHGVKGEEYTSVIAAGLLNGYLPHWGYIRDPIKNCVEKMKPISFFMFFALELKRICTYLVKMGEPQETVSNILQPMNSP